MLLRGPSSRWHAMSSTYAATRLNKSRVALAAKNGKLNVRQGERRIERVRLHSTRPVIVHAAAAQNDTTAHEVQLEGLKQVATLLRAELADIRAQRDEWRARANRLAASIAVASRSRPWWRDT